MFKQRQSLDARKLSGPDGWTYLALIVLACVAPSHVRGEDRQRQLPKDGAWARYDIEEEAGGKTEVTGTVTLSFVGTVTEDDVRCRWIERKTVIHDPHPKPGNYIVTMLVPETELLESDKPFAHARRQWVQGPGEAVERLDPPDMSAKYDELFLWTPGMLRGSELARNASKDIEYQRGELKNAAGRIGELVYRLPGNDKQELRYVSKYTAWQHPDLPFGFAEARIDRARLLGTKKIRQVFTVYRIHDFGTDAKSALPDKD